MICPNCFQLVPDSAQRCMHCEALISKINASLEEATTKVFKYLDLDTQQKVMRTMLATGTAEEFVNAIMVGPCPSCDSSLTGDCEDDPEIEDKSIGRCFDCGCNWCLSCSEDLLGNTFCLICCSHGGMCDEDDEYEEHGEDDEYEEYDEDDERE